MECRYEDKVVGEGVINTDSLGPLSQDLLDPQDQAVADVQVAPEASQEKMRLNRIQSSGETIQSTQVCVGLI